MLLRNKDQQEVVSNEKKDRRDFLQLETLATRMGLYRYVQFHINSFIFYSVSLFSFINIYIYFTLAVDNMQELLSLARRLCRIIALTSMISVR